MTGNDPPSPRVSGSDEEAPWEDITTFLERSQQQSQALLERELQRIQAELTERQAIHDAFRDDIEQRIERYCDRLEVAYRSLWRGDLDVEELTAVLEDLYRELHESERRLWRDRQELERERREVLGELDELQSRDLAAFVEDADSPGYG